MRKPYFRASRQCWYIVHQGKNVRLGKDKDEAFKRWHEIQAADKPADIQTPVNDRIVEFLDWCEKHRAPGTYEWYRFFLNSFRDSLGTMKLCDLQPFHVTRWLENRKYTGNTGNGAVRTVAQCFNWAVKHGKLKENPVKGVDRPAATPRESYITEAAIEEALEFKEAIRAIQADVPEWVPPDDEEFEEIKLDCQLEAWFGKTELIDFDLIADLLAA